MRVIGVPGGRSYAWLAGPLASACLVGWAARVDLGQAGFWLRALLVAVLLVGSAVLAMTPGVALLSVVARYRPLGPASGLGLLYAGAGTAAMAGFWAWFFSPRTGRILDAALLGLSVASIGVFGRRGELRRLSLSLPLALALAVSLVFTGIAFLQGGIAAKALHHVSAWYWLTADNNIPLQFADRVAAHRPLSGFLVGNWLSSDRPPLQTGFALLEWPLWHGPNQGASQQASYQLLATGLQVAWLPALWVLFQVRGLSTPRICAAVLATAATGAVFFNSVYVWPKMLAAALALTAVAVIVSCHAADRRRGAAPLAAALLTLSMLAHGGTAFAILALVCFVRLPWRALATGALATRAAVKAARMAKVAVAAAGCAVVAMAIYLPWLLYQRFVNPPGDRLPKWQLAGVIAIDHRSALQAIVQQYHGLTPGELLANKWVNLYTLVANTALWHAPSDPAWTGFLGTARVAQIYSLVPAAGPLLLGGLALLVPAARRSLVAARPLVIFTAVAITIWVIVLWGGQRVPTEIHEGSYALVVLFTGLCALAVTALPRPLAVASLAASPAWFAISWLPWFGFRPASPAHPPGTALDPAMVVLLAAGLAAVALLAVRAGPDRDVAVYARLTDPAPAAARTAGTAGDR